jgi:Reverse transcriptase (RNA-dependent DNA polymerase)/gag-polypeptide of LTR copia-type
MPKIPKISTKYDDLDSDYEGQETSQTENSTRALRSTNKAALNESNNSDHDADTDNSENDSFNSANNTENKANNSSPTILDSSQSSSSSHSSEMSLTEAQIKSIIATSIQTGIEQYIVQNPLPSQEHTPRISNIPQLTMTNYSDWARKIRAAMLLNQLWIDPTTLPANYNEKQKEKSKKAVQFIVMFLDESNNVHVTADNEECFYTVWKNLKDFHKPNTSMILCDFYCSLQSLIHCPGECVRTHLMQVEQQFNKLDDKDKLSEDHKVAIVLASIRKSPEFVSLFNSAKWLKTETLTLSNVKDTIISSQDQTKMDSRPTNNQAHAFPKGTNRNSFPRNRFMRAHNRQPRNLQKGWNCTNCQMDNHSNENCNKNPQNKQKKFSRQSHSAQTEQEQEEEHEEQEVNSANIAFGSFTIKNEIRHARSQLPSSSVKARLGNQTRPNSPYHNIRPFRISQSQPNADDDVDTNMLEFSDTYDDDNLNMLLNQRSSLNGTTLNICNKIHESNLSPQITKCHKLKYPEKHPSELPNERSQSHVNMNYTMLKTTTPRNKNVNFKRLPKGTPQNPEFQEFQEFQTNPFTCFNSMLKSQEMSLNKDINSRKISSWIIDSGASIHMCNDSSILENFKPHCGQFVTISNGDLIPITGFGSLKFQIFDYNKKICTITLKQVAFVPQLTVNLLSVRYITKSSPVMFTEDSCILLKPHKIKLGTLINSAFTLTITHKPLPQIATNNSFACIHEWHRRLSHRNLDQIKRIKDVLHLKISKCNCSNDCMSCIKSKIFTEPFPKQSRKPDFPREVITSDLGGDFKTQSIGGAKYFITFTCAATDFTEVATIRNKSDAKQEILNFMEKCKTQFGAYPKVFRSDRGGEYIDSELQKYLSSKGVIFQCTVANSPQQNGISERKNRTLVEAVRTLLLEKNLPHYLWGEALHHATFTFNNLPKINESKSPQEKFFNKKSEIEFIEFGSSVIFKLNTQNLSKLKPKGEHGIFVGFDRNSKGYRIYADHKVQIRRNVKFVDQNIHQTKIQDIQKSQDPEEPKILRRSERIQQQQSLLSHYEPRTYKQAMHCPDREHWLEAMKEELDSIESNNTWTKVELPKDRKAIGSRWIFKLKTNENGQVQRYKARLVAQGFTQVYGTDYDEVFAPVARPTSFRVLLTIAGIQNLHVMQYDVKTAFLNGTIEEEIYLKPPQGFQSETKVFRLHKSLYGLKQSARKWNEAIHSCLTKLNFTQSKQDNCLYVCHVTDDICYLIIHVDDILIAAKNISTIESLTKQITKSFELKSLGKAKQFLGININRRIDGLFEINQSSYIDKIATTLKLEDSKGSLFPIDPGYFKLTGSDLESNTEYRQIIGMLLYISTNSRPDISASVAILAQKVSNPSDIDLKESLRVVKYLLKTKNHSLIFGDLKSQTPLQAFSDANWAEDRTHRKSSSGTLCQVFGAPVSWSSKKQDVVAISTTESEYYALTETIREVIWLKELLANFQIIVQLPIPVFMDSQSCIKMVTNEKFSNRTKHIAVRFQFAKDIELKYVSTENNIADMLTKPLAGSKIKTLRELAFFEMKT